LSEPYSIFLPSDFSPASEKALAHSLAIAIIRKARLTMLHAGAAEWEGDAPSVREILARWGYLEQGAAREAVFDELGVRIQKIEARKSDPLQASLEYLERDPADLLVLSTEGRSGLPRWVRRSVAERLVRKTGMQALFVPDRVPGFIDVEDGRSSLRRILVPFASPRSLLAAAEAQRLSTASQLQVTVLHFADAPPRMGLPERAGVSWETVCEPERDAVAQILQFAESNPCDLIVMPIPRRARVVEAVRGSITERVLRASPCPILAVE
jgi:nucleotide-binding universal stress UspA family protein